jgi:hypothetical protein
MKSVARLTTGSTTLSVTLARRRASIERALS